MVPLRIEWKQNTVQELDDVLVVEFPSISKHLSTLVLSEGTVSSIVSRQTSPRKSIIIFRELQNLDMAAAR